MLCILFKGDVKFMFGINASSLSCKLGSEAKKLLKREESLFCTSRVTGSLLGLHDLLTLLTLLLFVSSSNMISIVGVNLFYLLRSGPFTDESSDLRRPKLGSFSGVSVFRLDVFLLLPLFSKVLRRRSFCRAKGTYLFGSYSNSTLVISF